MDITYSELSVRTKSSEIRELLKYTRMKDIISFAGGLPDPRLFPIEDIARITNEVLSAKGILALQYGPTPGEPEFIEALVEHMGNFNEKVSTEQICVTSSSQQGLDLLSLIMINEGDEIIMELPSYLGAIQAFERSGAKMNGIQLEQDGINIEKLVAIIKEKHTKGKQIRFIYTIPDYQNPSGIMMSLEKRIQLLEIANQWQIPIIEDSPYREISFNNIVHPSLWSLSEGKGVIQLKTFSKILFPGMRLGWITAEKEIINKLALMKQSVDLCSPSFNQLIVAQFIKEGKMKSTIMSAIEIYREKNATMLSSLEKWMPKGVEWSKPTGGMFLWVKLPENIDAKEMVESAVKNHVVYVTGRPFHCDGSGKNTMRLNYSFPTLAQIEMGIKSLAETINEIIEIKNTIPNLK
jgi:2-aminoadipate transaminase